MADLRFKNKLNEARASASRGAFTEAEKIYHELLLEEPAPGERILVLDGLARCQYARKNISDAEKSFREALKLLRQLFGSEHLHVAGALQNLARIVSEHGRSTEAAELGKEALSILCKNLPEQDPRIADALINLSSHQYAAKDYPAAEANLKKALLLWEQAEGRECFGVSTCLNNLGRICEERGETGQGVRYHQEAMSIRKKILGDHPETAFSMGNCGAALAGNAQWAQAAITLQEALDCYARLGLADTPDAATCRQNLDMCREAAKKS